ncbi:molybdenum cofactor guanylyltransferase [Homoserinimonas sp. A447]
MFIDAIVLAGGRSSRLGEVPKAGLAYRQQTLLEHTVGATRFARTTVIVGDPAGIRIPGVLIAREEPAFGGPAAAVAAGINRLAQDQAAPSEFTFVLACDMPGISTATAAIREALGSGVTSDGLIAIDADEHPQPLAAVYRTASLASAITAHGRHLEGLSMFRLIAGLQLTDIAVPPGSTDDVDTWDDAARFGITRPETMEEP